MADVDLSRFEAEAGGFDRALAEIEQGRKRSHWMWFVFPQVKGLGSSPTARRYAIASVDEAGAFLAHPVLGANYRRVVAAVRQQVVDHGVTVRHLFGSPDDLKLISSLTLFAGVAQGAGSPGPGAAELVTAADEILGAAYAQGLAPCTTTEAFLVR